MRNLLRPYRTETHYLPLHDSLEVAYTEAGTGSQTLLFIHGLASYIPAWDLTIGAFSDQYRCIAIDLPGYGRSKKGDYPATMQWYAEVVLAVAEALQVQHLTLVGHSMGGQIAITAALTAPEKVQRLVLISPAGFETFQERGKAWLRSFYTEESIMNATPDQIRTNFGYNFYSMPKRIDALIEERITMAQAHDFRLYCRSVVRGVKGMISGPVFDRLSTVQQPALVIYGSNDFLIPNRYLNPSLTTRAIGEAGAAQLPNAQLHFIDACGHFVPLEKPGEANALMLNFLKGN